ncbi:MAG: lactonase family protein [Paludisphaera borealis]|uniref:lactonase family protein n=1 Tax=Paludisphaera borealis TaxID=1387353 RepID=UPI002844062A|nr:lactonase family protein [Paludisphaera borealis]MDR3621255.1 lactonase family protein [Paludisphaera borealis]
MTVARWLMVARRAVLASMAVLASAADGAEPKSYWVYAGSYTNSKTPSEGIYKFELDAATGKLTPHGPAAKLANPSFLAVHPNGKFLYAVNEVETLNGEKGGGVTALALDPETGALRVLNHQSTKGGAPCHLTVDAKGRNVLAANYGGGSVACLPIAEDGTLKPASTFIQHEGKSVDRSRQEAPHAHSINLDRANRFALAADLGLDKVLVYKFDGDHGKLTPNDPPFAKIKPGTGPRHLAWHPSGDFAYVIGEMGNTVTVLKYDAAKGVLDAIQTIGTLPADFHGKSWTSEIVAHPTGNFVYGSNRGHDSIAIFTVEASTGKLKATGHQLTGGKTPRNFVIDPTGRWLLAENQDSNTIVVFRIDPQTGALAQVGEPVASPMPVCIRMIPKPAAGK